MKKNTLLVCFSICVAFCRAQMPATGNQPSFLHIHYVDKDSSITGVNLQRQFSSQFECIEYISRIPSLLNANGYPAASVDSSWFELQDVHIKLYVGRRYQWFRLIPDSIEQKALDQSGFIAKNYSNRPIDIAELRSVQQRLLDHYENNGYPFAAVYLDSIRLIDDQLQAKLKVKTGPLYHIDSMRIYGKAKVSRKFLQHYLNIPNGSIYSKQKLEQVSKRLLELPYLQEQQPSDITMLGKGALLNLYIVPKRSSQANFLVGFLPATGQTGKLQVTGDVNLNLKNALSNGESILINWQQLQPKSPRLNLAYQQPYIFNSNFGIDFQFDLFKKDSSFLQINGLLGLQYLLSANQSGKIFFQNQRTFLLLSGIDTNQVKATKQLPPNVDVSASNFGVDYEFYNTNYRLNPKSGNELKVTASVGIKKISPNNDILNLKEPGFNYASLYDSVKLRSYQFRVKVTAAHFVQLGKQSTLKLGMNAGMFSSQSIFRNELFQLGGYRLLRGFDEESIYATQYLVPVAEFRYLVSLNSYFFVFADGGFARNKYQSVDQKNSFISSGIGLVFETKLGLLNISYAVGKRNDIPFNLRSASKIHFGYVNYF